MDSAISVTGLTKRFSDKAVVDGVSLDLMALGNFV